MKECLIIGKPVIQSLSPLMHNTGYKSLGIDKEYKYSAREVSSEDLENVIKEIRAANVVGVSVTIPHKVTVMNFLDEIDITAKTIGAVNTISKVDSKLKGINTDWLGVLTPLSERCNLTGQKASIFGAGGAARAACYALLTGGAEVTIINRTTENARKLANDFNCSFLSKDDIKDLESFDIIINSVPYDPKSEIFPLNPIHFREKHIFFDMIYIPYKTPLIIEAEKRGAKTIPGIEMLLHQGIEQFRIFTGRDAPIAEMKKALIGAVNK